MISTFSFSSFAGLCLGIIAKAFLTGIGLGTGFIVAGWCCNNIQYYSEAFLNGNIDKIVGANNSFTGTYRQQLNNEWWFKPFAMTIKEVERLGQVLH